MLRILTLAGTKLYFMRKAASFTASRFSPSSSFFKDFCLIRNRELVGSDLMGTLAGSLVFFIFIEKIMEIH